MNAEMNPRNPGPDGGRARLPTGIPGLDRISGGGLPSGRSTLVSGTAGSGKTTLGVQFLMEGIRRYEQAGVLVTFQESPEDLADNVGAFGWNLQRAQADGRLAFVDATPNPDVETVPSGSFDLSALLARVKHAVSITRAERVLLDSVDSLFAQFEEPTTVRRELQRLLARLKELGTTTLLTMERTGDNGRIGRHGVEEFVADNVIVLRNRLELGTRRRTLEVLKLRGAIHSKGEQLFTIDSRTGVTIIPLSNIELEQKSSSLRVTSGIAELDQMCGGGFFRDSIILVSGATGTGKTLLASEFVRAGAEAEERALFVGTEESREQLFRNATSWGIDFGGLERQGHLRVVCSYPEAMGMEDHLLRLKLEMEEFRPTRVAVDSLSAFARCASRTAFREFVIGLTSHIKHLEIPGLFTNTTTMIFGGDVITETNLATMTDTILLLRYLETEGELRRALAVLKMRGTRHDRGIREMMVDDQGMHIGQHFRNVQGILSGQSPTWWHPSKPLDRSRQAPRQTSAE